MNSDIKEILNYSVFMTLFIGSFYFIYRTYTEIIGLSILSITNGAFLLFMFTRISDKLPYVKPGAYIANLAFFSIMVGLLFTFISLVFTLSMIYTTNQKYSAKYGTNLELPEPYHTEVDIYKRIMISCYCLIAILAFLTMPNGGETMSILNIYSYINTPIKFPTQISLGTMSEFLLTHKYHIVATATSLALLGLSSYIIFLSNGFLKLNRRRISA